MLKNKNIKLEQSCIKSINEISEHKMKCNQAALKFVCRVSKLVLMRNLSDSDSIDNLLQDLFNKARKRLSPDLKTRYRQAILYLRSKNVHGTEQEMIERCKKMHFTSYRKLADAYVNQSKKAPSIVSGASKKAKSVPKISAPSLTLKKTKGRKQSSGMPKNGRQNQSVQKTNTDIKKVERLIKQVSKSRQTACYILKTEKVKVIVKPC